MHQNVKAINDPYLKEGFSIKAAAVWKFCGSAKITSEETWQNPARNKKY